MASNLVEREYIALRTQRHNLRQVIKNLATRAFYEGQKRFGPDGYDNAIVRAQAALRGTEPRWNELCMLLRKPLPGPPVKLNAPVRRAAPRPTIRASAPYLTRAMRSG